MAPNTFPEDWRDQPCFLVAVPRPLVPYVGGLLKLAEQRGFWATEEDYLRGYTSVTELEECLMATCLNDLLEKQDALYRMLNTALMGQVYESDEGDPPTISPAIDPFVSLSIYNRASVNGRLEDLLQMMDNSLNGTETPNYNNPPSVREQLQAIIDAIGEGTDLTEVITDLELIIGALA